MTNTFKTHVRPLLEFSSPVWNTGYIEDAKLMERVQRQWTKEIVGLKFLPYSERLKQLDLFSVQGRLLRADLILCWKILNGMVCIPNTILPLSPESRTRGHTKRIALPSVNTSARQRYFSYRVIQPWNNLPEHVSANCLKTFKTLLKEEL